MPKAIPPEKVKPVVEEMPSISKQSAGTKFYLRDQDGLYLHQACLHMTSDKNYAWTGLERQLIVIRKSKVAQGLHEEVVL